MESLPLIALSRENESRLFVFFVQSKAPFSQTIPLAKMSVEVIHFSLWCGFLALLHSLRALSSLTRD